MSKREMMMRRIITTITFVIIIVGCFGYLGKKVAANVEANRIAKADAERIRLEEEKRKEEEFKRQKQEELQAKINDILTGEHEKVVKAIEEIVNGNKNYGIYYEDLASGKVYSFNERKDFTAASTIKVPLVVGAADLIATGKLSPDSTVKYIQADYEGGTGILQGTSELNNPIKLGRLMELAITHSDNIATQMLKRVSTDITTVVNKVTGIPRKAGGNYINAEQLGIFLKRLYKNENNNPQYDIIIENMKNTIFHDRLDKYIEPQNIVAHKIGNYGGFTHDTGITYTDRPYSLTVLTQSIGSETTAKMNKAIYDIKVETDNSIENLKEQYRVDFNLDLE